MVFTTVANFIFSSNLSLYIIFYTSYYLLSSVSSANPTILLMLFLFFLILSLPSNSNDLTYLLFYLTCITSYLFDPTFILHQNVKIRNIAV